jgi:hypothetical protein
MATTVALSNRAQDARSAMCALVMARGLSIDEMDPGYPALIAKVAWLIADAMADERVRRQRGGK